MGSECTAVRMYWVFYKPGVHSLGVHLLDADQMRIKVNRQPPPPPRPPPPPKAHPDADS